MHGAFIEASTWFIAPPSENLPMALRLHEAGYDVWLGNMRGTQYSQKHESLDANDFDSGYWNFSMAEKGMLDMPATIDQIKKTSNVDKVAYIGMSMSTTMMFQALSSKVEEDYFADNMSAFIALAPCMVGNRNFWQDYDKFIANDWPKRDTVPYMAGPNFSKDEYCAATNNGDWCTILTGMFQFGDFWSTQDTRSLF